MAMIRCPICGERYSDTYKYCPFCEEEEALEDGEEIRRYPQGGHRGGGRRCGRYRIPHVCRGRCSCRNPERLDGVSAGVRRARYGGRPWLLKPASRHPGVSLPQNPGRPSVRRPTFLTTRRTRCVSGMSHGQAVCISCPEDCTAGVFVCGMIRETVTR